MKNIKRKTGIIALTFLLSQSITAPAIFAETSEVTVKEGFINVRDGAGMDFPIVAKVKEGERFSVLENTGEWIKIQVNDEKEGWVAEWLVSSKNESLTSTENISSSGFTTVDGLRIRKGPGMDYPVVSVLSKDTEVEITGQSGSWVSVKAGSSSGFISEEYIRTNSHTLSFGKITADSVRLRSAPSLDADILGEIEKDVSVEVTKEENGWTNILYQDQSYWISSKYVSEKSSHSSGGGMSVEITASSLNVRSSAKTNSTVIGTVKKGHTYKVLSQEKQWYEIRLEDGKKGWIAAWYAKPSDNRTSSDLNMDEGEPITITKDRVNIRTGPGTTYPITKVTSIGETYKLIGTKEEWSEVQLSDGNTGFIATRLLSGYDSDVQAANNGQSGPLSGKLIVLDAGHGGTDSGAIGTSGHFEKQLTLRTALLLSSKLKEKGASVLLTRTDDQYISLSDRALLANQQAADAFISIHYDSTVDIEAGGITTYYTHNQQQELASHIQRNLIRNATTEDRGIRQASLRVLRENKRPAVLVELGYISNPAEESLLHTSGYQEIITDGLLHGLNSFLNSK